MKKYMSESLKIKDKVVGHPVYVWLDTHPRLFLCFFIIVLSLFRTLW